MIIAIIGAMEVEITSLIEELKNKQEIREHSFTFFVGEIAQHRVIILLSGIGKVAAAVGTSLLIRTFSPELVINTGVAGGLQNARVLDLVLANEVRYHDVDVTAFGYEFGQQAQMPPAYLPDEKHLDLFKTFVEKNAPNLKLGTIVSGDAFINQPEKKQQIERFFPSAFAVEMEAAAIAQTCFLLKTPFLVLRAISDTANEATTLSYETFVAEAGKISAKINLDFINHLP